MTVRCKFVCESVTHMQDGAQIKMRPVVSGSPENDLFFKYTPYGSFDFGTVNKTAVEQFVPGETYYIDITPAKG